MSKDLLLVHQSPKLSGTVTLTGAKNATLVIIASLILTEGKSTLLNVPNSADTLCMIKLMEELGATITFETEKNILHVDTSSINKFNIHPNIMNKMRASILVMGPLLARFGKTHIALPGGDLIGARPINYHLKGLKKLGVQVENNPPFINAIVNDNSKVPEPVRIPLEYPSVGATENILMFATLRQGETTIINASIEPEVIDLVTVLNKMGAKISFPQHATIHITGTIKLNPITHRIMPDRMEAGALLLAAGITGGSIHLPNARVDHLDMFLETLKEMGHKVEAGTNPSKEYPLQGIKLYATQEVVPVNIKTGPYPSFPSDLQALIMVALSLAQGTSKIEETVFENRFIHVNELKKMGAQISVEGNAAIIRGVETLFGCKVIASDIRASCALALAGLVAEGETKITGIHHWQRGYDHLEKKLQKLGAFISLSQSNLQDKIRGASFTDLEDQQIIQKPRE